MKYIEPYYNYLQTSFKKYWRDDWQNIFKKYKVDATIELILSKWNEPHRFYHNQLHLYSIISDIEKLNISEQDYEKLVLIALFHDIIYIPGRDDNEAKSAEYFLYICKDKNNTDIQEVCQSIIDTKKHTSKNRISKIFNEIDMKIVESDYDSLLEWEEKIKKEYTGYYSKEEYKKGRLEFLKSILPKYPKNKLNLKKLIQYVLNN